MRLAYIPAFGYLLIQFGKQVGRVVALSVGVVAHRLGVGALFDPPPLRVGGLVRLDDRFAVEVLALPALRGPQVPGPFGASIAVRPGFPGGPALGSPAVTSGWVGVGVVPGLPVAAGPALGQRHRQPVVE